MNRPDAALRVLMVGPPAESAGGMYAVAASIREGLATQGSPIRVLLVDSGGGLGRAGYRRFPRAALDIARLRPDLVHLHVASKGSTIRKTVLAAISRLWGIPYVIHLHGGGYADFLAGLGGPSRTAVEQFFRHAAHVVVLGRTWQDLVIDELGVSKHQVTVVHNGVRGVGDGSPEARTILFIGAATRDKGADTLVEAAHGLLAGGTHPGWTVRFVGSTPDPEIIRRAQDGAAHDRIVFSGPLFGAEKDEAIREAAVLALPSRAEALPMVVLEAMSAGLPCVCSRVGSIPEILADGATGLLVNPGDPGGLATALAELMEDDAVRHRMGDAARRRWRESLTQEALADAVARIWTDVAR